jgi:3-phytase
MSCSLVLVAGLFGCAHDGVRVVRPSGETTPVRTSGDAADDIAIWVHPSDPSRSRIIGTDKQRGLVVYTLEGEVAQEVEGARINNVDLVDGFELGGRPMTVVAGSDRNGNSIALFGIDPDSGRLRPIAARVIGVEGGAVYGLCMMRSARSGESYVFVSTTADEIQQWRLFEREGGIDAELKRRFSVGGHAEGMVADAEHNTLFVAEEDVGIWRYEAEPAWVLTGRAAGHEEMSASEAGARTLIGQVGRDALAADVEGLALYRMPRGGGYLIAANQGDDTFAVFERVAPNRHIGSFTLGEAGGVDAVSGTDGVEASSAALGPAYPYGILVVQDDQNEGGNQNFKIVPWERVAAALGLGGR